MHCEILCPPEGVRYSSKAVAFLRELEKFKPRGASFTSKITGRGDYLICYGPTGRTAKEARARYEGKPWVALDLGYWDRIRADYPMRVSINAVHPNEHLEDYGPQRWAARRVELADDYDPHGHVLVAGAGRKSVANGVDRCWDDRAVARARARFGRRVRYRPKPLNRMINMQSPIQPELVGAAYVVTHHSNVGIDAIMQGIPVATEEGAARWLYSNDLDNKPATPERRLDFLQRLAWWNWRRSEAPGFWSFIQERIHERIR